MSNKAECAVGGFLPYEGLLLIARKDRNMRLWWNESSWTSYLVRKLTKYKIWIYLLTKCFYIFWKPLETCWSPVLIVFFCILIGPFFNLGSAPGSQSEIRYSTGRECGHTHASHRRNTATGAAIGSMIWSQTFQPKIGGNPDTANIANLGVPQILLNFRRKSDQLLLCSCSPCGKKSGHPSMIPRKKRILKCLQSFLDWIRYTVTVTVGITCCLKQHVFGICGRWENVAISWDSVGTSCRRWKKLQKVRFWEITLFLALSDIQMNCR